MHELKNNITELAYTISTNEFIMPPCGTINSFVDMQVKKLYIIHSCIRG